MYKALYRKYRPLTFGSVVGQEHITTTLQNQVENGTFSHAYLFTGSRGTGKTTCAKILSRAVNCLNPNGGNPCGECENCRAILNESTPDVIELDAASNRKIDDIRDLRDRIAFAPQQEKYKVYIIDEVHMLTNEASNALLKTLEEPPEHAIFILATTEVHEILPTILSRCQRYDFKRIEPSDIASRLLYVAEQESLELSQDAALLIAQIADGGMRDALSVLDLCSGADSKIDASLVNRICGRASKEKIFELAQAINNLDTPKALSVVSELHDESVDLARLSLEMCGFWRNITLIKAGIDPKFAVNSTDETAKEYLRFSKDVSIERAMFALKAFSTAGSEMSSGNKRDILEMAIIKLCNPEFDTSKDALLARISDLERAVKSGVQLKKTVEKAPENVKKPAASSKPLQPETQPEVKPHPDTPKPTETSASAVPVNNWKDILESISQASPLLIGLTSGTTATLEGENLVIHNAPIQLKRILSKPDDLNYKKLKEAVFTTTGKNVRLTYKENNSADAESDPLSNFLDKLDNLR